MRRSRLSGSVLCLLLGVLVSSCSGNGSRQVGGGQALVAAALSTTESAPLATPKEQLLLQQSDLPTGAQQEAIPPDALASQLSDGLGRVIQITPPQCSPSLIDANKAVNTMRNGTVAAAYLIDGGAYGEMITGQDFDVNRQKSLTSGACAHPTLTGKTDDGDPIEASSTFKTLPLPPGLDPAYVYVYQQTTTRRVGTEESTRSVEPMGMAGVRGVTVSVYAVDVDDHPLDYAEFNTLFAAAIEKVQQAA